MATALREHEGKRHFFVALPVQLTRPPRGGRSEIEFSVSGRSVLWWGPGVGGNKTKNRPRARGGHENPTDLVQKDVTEM